MRAAILVILCCIALLHAPAQILTPPADSAPQTPQNLDQTRATLHGFVRNAATGEGIPRALVRIEGDFETGALTDGDGRFEIEDVPVGPQAVDVSRPGFFNPAFAGSVDASSQVTGPPHNVLVASVMADVVFTLAPACALRGRVDLSTGDVAEGIGVVLVRRVVSSGRAVWRQSGFTKTRSDGSYRFGGLADGLYAVYTMPSLDSQPYGVLVAGGKAAAADRWGYAAVYYPDARDPSGAAVIPLSNGSEAQANLALTREPFYTVSVAVPQTGPGRTQPQYTAELTDGRGDILPYPTEYDSSSHTIQAVLPDGTYSMLVSAVSQPALRFDRGTVDTSSANAMLTGQADFAIAGHAIPNLRIALAPVTPSPIQVTILRGGGQTVSSAAGGINADRIDVMASRAGSPTGNAAPLVVGTIGGDMSGDYARGSAEGPLRSSYMDPGQYWVHTFLAGRGLCESSFTAGGASLGREPLTIGLSGQTAPLELTLRDDCAQLALHLPQDLAQIVAGEEKFYTVFVVPDFDFTWDIAPVVLRASSGGAFRLDNLTPGNYHVYVFENYADLAYHNPAALAALQNPGQAVTLSPGATADLVLEVPAQ